VEEHYDIIILGAGASGLMCAAEASRRGRKTLVLDNGPRAGRKILIAGGGKCNFTNMDVGAEHFISENPHFCKSALSRYSQWDFLALMKHHAILWEERDHGRLFAMGSASEIRDMMEREARSRGAKLKTGIRIDEISRAADGKFIIRQGDVRIIGSSLVVATGGLSYPSVGASPLGFQIAEQFGLKIVPPSPGLVPLTLGKNDKDRWAPLAGIAVPAAVTAGGRTFTENLLLTHRGLSGPGILQASNYWNSGEEVLIDLLPEQSVLKILDAAGVDSEKGKLKTLLSQYLPRRLIAAILPGDLADKPAGALTMKEIDRTASILHRWQVRPGGTEGYRTAEVTQGGVDTAEISSKTFESRKVPGLYFIGEVLDVTGQLGGYNLQWAWSSGWCAGGAV
jgi:predicted Rossmann fold flavoprotein